MELKLYVLRSKDGKYFKSKGYQGIGASWRDEIGDAKVYAKPGPARSQVTWWATHFPQFGVPDLLEITITEDNIKVLNETSRVDKVKLRKEREEKERQARLEREKALKWWGNIKSVRDKMEYSKSYSMNKLSTFIHPDDLTVNQIVEVFKYFHASKK